MNEEDFRVKGWLVGKKSEKTSHYKELKGKQKKKKEQKTKRRAEDVKLIKEKMKKRKQGKKTVVRLC